MAAANDAWVLEPDGSEVVETAEYPARLAYATEHGATMALTQAAVDTSSPILRRLGFVSYGRERSHRLPLG